MITGLIVIVTLLDQLTKWLVQRYLDFGDSVTVIPGLFDFSKVYNHGAAWGMLAGQRVMLVAVSALMLVFLWFSRKDILSAGRWERLGAGLLAGGIIGNLIDRVKFGYVIDFLDFHWGDYTFPTFNVADSAICVGVALFVVFQFIGGKTRADDHE